MIFVDCRKCENLGEDECMKYGNDANAAVAACANDGFENYRIREKNRKLKMKGRREEMSRKDEMEKIHNELLDNADCVKCWNRPLEEE